MWTEDGTQVATGVMPELTLGKGVYTFTLTVTDDNGATASDDVIVTVTKGSGGGGSYGYQVCEANDATACSNQTTVTF